MLRALKYYRSPLKIARPTATQMTRSRAGVLSRPFASKDHSPFLAPSQPRRRPEHLRVKYPPLLRANSDEAAIAWKQAVGTKLRQLYSEGSGGHALGSALLVMAKIHNPDGARAIAATLNTKGVDRLLASEDPTDIAELQAIESRFHALAPAETYKTQLGHWLRNLPARTRINLHILEAKIEDWLDKIGIL